MKEIREVLLSKNEKKLLENGWGYEIANNIITNEFFYNSDGIKIKGYLSYPKLIDNILPVIIWNRGGNNSSGLLDDFLASGILGEIASWGYIVFASQYRENDEFGGRDVYDVLNLIDVAKRFDLSDGNSIGMEGWSRGGMMSYITLTKTSGIKCCIIVAGLSNLLRSESYNPKLSKIYRYHFGTELEEEFLIRKKERSAVYNVDKINRDTNILLIHGTADEKISAEDSIEMYRKLCIQNVNTKYELKLIAGGDHYLRKERKNLSHIRKKWLDSYLKLKN